MIPTTGIFSNTPAPVYSAVTFEDVKKILYNMLPSERRKVADYLVCDASELAVRMRYCDIVNQTEQHM